MTTVVDARLPGDGTTAAVASTAKVGPRRRLFAKYAAALVGLVGLVLLVNGLLNVWFSYHEARDAAIRLQHEKADAAAQRIDDYITEIEKQIGWTTATQWASSPIDQRRFDYGRLQRQVPAITELIQLDGQGHEQLKVSRLAMDVQDSRADYSADPRFTEALAKKVWFGPVYFRKESEPYMTMSVAQSGRNAGVTVAEVNLKLIWDVITGIKIGKTGYAYVVDDKGRLIAHPDISRVLRNTDLTALPQVAAARDPAGSAEPAGIVRNLDGHRVLSASAPIRKLGWLVFVEQPISEALAPLYTAVLNTGFLLLLGLAVAILAGLLLARRMTGPIRELDAGAARIGAGALDHRIAVHTGDELEELAQRFNTMAEDLQSSYADLEKKVEDRTAELKESLDQQTATAEVLGVINSSPGDLAPVFDAMLERATRLCEAAFGLMSTYDGERYHTVATHGVAPELAEYMRAPPHPDPESALGRIERGEDLVLYDDIADTDVYRKGDPRRRAIVDLGGAHSYAVVALRKDRRLLGIIAAYRREVRPFSDKQIALLQNFAAQAVIAIENARLITETREALEQQTATAEVLGVINSSPGDLAPVFDAILEKAHTLCGASKGSLVTVDGEHFRTVATRGLSEPYEVILGEAQHNPPGSAPDRLLTGEKLVHIPDVRESEFAIPRAAAELEGARTIVYVPLRKDSALLGYITAYRQEVRPFSDKQIALLQNFAAQAVIAMENARLITETQEALEQQTATSEVLHVISSSPGDLAPVFQTVLENAVRICEAKFGTLYLREADGFRGVAMHNVPPSFAEARTRGLLRPPSDAPLGQVAATKQVAHITDIRAMQSYIERDPLVVAAAESGGYRTVLSVPMLKDNELIGAININRQEVRPFTDKQIELVKSFASQAVIAIENARLLDELRQRTRDLQESLEYQTATSDVLKVISRSAFDLDAVLEAVVSAAIRLCRAEHAAIYRNEDGEYRWAAGNTQPPEYERIERNVRIRPGQGTLVGRTALECRTVQIPDVLDDPLYEPKEDARVGNARTMLGVPLLRENAPVGVIGLVRNRVEPFSEREIALVRTFADQAVIAIENARLFNELRARTTELGSSVAELKMLNDVAQAVSSTLDLRSVLSTILTSSLGMTWANAGAVFRYSRAERAFRLVEAVGWDEALLRSVRDLRLAEAETAMGEAVARRVPVQLANTEQRASNPLRDLTLAAGYHSALIVPLLGAERIFGAIILLRQEAGQFPAETVRLMQTLASQSVLAIQNARLFREIADKSEQLALASQHKSQFLANMSHELRTPLNAILGYAELLVDGIYGVLPDRPKGVLDRIQNNGKHLLALINDVLDLAKIEAGQLTLTLEDYTLPEVVRSVVTATEPLATSKGLNFTATLQDNMPMGHGDARRLSQVLLNLVGNAIKFTEAGEVEISATSANGQFVLSVRDTGAGIADADQDRIFGEFQQVDNTNTRNKGGTGLGLAISKRMVEMQGGTISVESVLGQGSTFRVVLPVHVDEMMEAAE
jgi:GAF domain-containing protein/anti-sigma regulatory factor (Ser/Thr protein kinase)